MPIVPLFNTNNTFQWSKGVVKGGRKEVGRRERADKKGEISSRGEKIAKGNGGSLVLSLVKLLVQKGFICFLLQITTNSL